jgi:hypothetical protein
MEIGDVTANPMDDIQVPVTVSDVTGWGVMAFEITLCWCDIPAGLIQLLGCSPGPVMSASGWTFLECYPCSTNCISVASAGISPLIGSGVLFYVNFHVSANAKPCMCCPVWFTEILLWDPEDPLYVCPTNGEVCIDYCEISGYVHYWRCCPDGCGGEYLLYPLQGALVHLEGMTGPVASQYTSVEGYYEFECLDPLIGPGALSMPDYYCVSVDMCPPLACITAYDASLILRYLVCLEDLDECPFPFMRSIIYPQMVAADVNCSGLITAMDASLILQYVVHLIDAFPCFDIWTFYPSPWTEGEPGCVWSCNENTRIDWIGIMFGDVSGCPDCPPDRAGAMAPAVTKIRMGEARHYYDTLEMPVIVENADDVTAVYLEISFRSKDLDVEFVEPVGLAGGFMAFHNVENNKLIIAMASMVGFSGDGDILLLRFHKKREGRLRRSISIDYVLFNEGDPEAAIMAPSRAEGHKFMMGPVAPNPFTGMTTIHFSMATAGYANLGIYGVDGRLVAKLVDGEMPAGAQSIVWDGKDNAGNRVARGVYFCRMETPQFSGTEKIIMLR